MQKKIVREGLWLERVVRLSRIVGSELGQRLRGWLKKSKTHPSKRVVLVNKTHKDVAVTSKLIRIFAIFLISSSNKIFSSSMTIWCPFCTGFCTLRCISSEGRCKPDLCTIIIKTQATSKFFAVESIHCKFFWTQSAVTTTLNKRN